MRLLFSATLFVSAFLLFFVQPMAAKMLLPILGGSPSVWNTAMVFFQIMLLAGYIYAHKSIQFLGARKQSFFHMFLLYGCLPLLPFTTASADAGTAAQMPITWMLKTLMGCAGFLFFVISASAPMIQGWFAATAHADAKDPYFLYTASNLGSLIALLGYPTLFEPYLTLRQQAWLWSIGFIILVVLTTLCALVLWNQPIREKINAIGRVPGAVEITWRRRIKWLLFSFIPSSIMLGVTTYITTDIAPIPLFWVLPLALYLLSFILVFSRSSFWTGRFFPWLLLASVSAYLPLVVFRVMEPLWLTISFHLAGLFLISMVFHGTLAQERPSANNLTEFYVWMSTGGMLGGIFNGICAPFIFRTLAEYPLVIVLTTVFFPFGALDAHAHDVLPATESAFPKNGLSKEWKRFIRFLLPGIALVFLFGAFDAFDLNDKLGLKIFFLCLVLAAHTTAFYFPRFFGLVFAVFMGIGYWYSLSLQNPLKIERSFFGVVKVVTDASGDVHLLTHGNISHGGQYMTSKYKHMPLFYYTTDGPIGQVFRELKIDRKGKNIAIIGLGTGVMAEYGRPWQKFDFFEIDPLVANVAMDHNYFTFLTECSAQYRIILGDGRISMMKARDKSYDLIAIDAYSSDSIPIHLLTREALQIYLSKLADNGILVFHISNRYLDLEPVLGNLAKDLNLAAITQNYDPDKARLKYDEVFRYVLKSRWVLLAGKKENFGRLANEGNWLPVRCSDYVGVWCDDYSNIFWIYRWN